MPRLPHYFIIKAFVLDIHFPISPFCVCVCVFVFRFIIASRSASGPPCGTRIIAGRIVKESYGASKQQHTFTVSWGVTVFYKRYQIVGNLMHSISILLSLLANGK